MRKISLWQQFTGSRAGSTTAAELVQQVVTAVGDHGFVSLGAPLAGQGVQAGGRQTVVTTMTEMQ